MEFAVPSLTFHAHSHYLNYVISATINKGKVIIIYDIKGNISIILLV